MRIVLDAGHELTGTVFDVAGNRSPTRWSRPSRKDPSQRKATLTDANGKFALRGLRGGLTTVTARALDIKQKVQLPIGLNGDKLDLEVRLRPM